MACKALSSYQGLLQTVTICHQYGCIYKLPDNLSLVITNTRKTFHSSSILLCSSESDGKDQPKPSFISKSTPPKYKFDIFGDYIQQQFTSIGKVLSSVSSITANVTLSARELKFPDFKSRAKRYEIRKEIGYLENRALEDRILGSNKNAVEQEHDSKHQDIILTVKEKRLLTEDFHQTSKNEDGGGSLLIQEQKESKPNEPLLDEQSTSVSNFSGGPKLPHAQNGSPIKALTNPTTNLPQQDHNTSKLWKNFREQLSNVPFFRSFQRKELDKVTEPQKRFEIENKDSVVFAEEFETENYNGPYEGDVIIQSHEKTKKREEIEQRSTSAAIQGSSIFREDLEPTSELILQRSSKESTESPEDKNLAVLQKTKSDVKQFMEDNGATSIFNGLKLMTDASVLKAQLAKFSSMLPQISSSNTTQKNGIDDRLKELDIESELISETEVEDSYFDSNAPLIDMTQAINSLEKSAGYTKPHGGERIRVQPRVIKEVSKVDPVTHQQESKAQRSKKPTISKASIDGRTKSITQGFCKASTNGTRIMRLERLCTHLIEYPDSRHVAVQENVIPQLLRLRASTVNQVLLAEISQALCLLGYVDPVKGRGIRILAIDGGGTKGIVPIEMLRQLEVRSNQKIRDMFDYIMGVSSGAVLAFLLSIAKSSLDECESLYKEFSVLVFERNPLLGTGNLLLNHAFYDTESWMNVLREHMKNKGDFSLSETARDPTCPKVASLATLMNFGYLKDFVFRNYNHPPESNSFYQGSCQYQLWEALRASSAAPGYFKEFKLDDFVFQDGGILTNNPCAIAVHECRLLWPDTPIQCVVSVGTGRYDPGDENVSTEYSSLKTKILKIMDSATDSQAVHIILQDLLPSGTYFRFNPKLSEQFLLDENRPEKIEQMQQEAKDYIMRNELKLIQAAGVLTREKNVLHKTKDWVKLQRDIRRKAPRTR